MLFSNTTVELLASLDALSKNALVSRNDLGILIELAVLHNQSTVLGELGFAAKFVSKTFGIMRRIGKDGEGYDRVSNEFSQTLEKAKVLLGVLLENAPHATREHFTTIYLGVSHESLQQLLLLCNDLAWYKNWLIDHPKHQQR